MAVHWGGRGPGHISRMSSILPPFDFFVDPAGGSDSNSGTLASPFATLSHAITSLGVATGQSIGIKRGTTLRNDTATVTNNGTRIGAYGVGADPALFGSSQTAVSSFTKATNLYTLTGHTFNPFSLALVDVSGNATKLKATANSGLNTAVDPAAEGEWTWFPATHATYPNQLKFYTTATITGYQVEVPQGGTAINGLSMLASDCTVENLNIRYWSGAGTAFGGDNNTWRNVEASFNSADGFDCDQHTSNFLADTITSTDNGQRWGASNGSGDGFSAHYFDGVGASGLIINSTFKRNMQTGVGNQTGTDVTVYGCYFENNDSDHYTYRAIGGTSGKANCDYSIFVHTIQHGTDMWSNANGAAGSAEEAFPVRYRNCSIYYTGVTATSAASFQNFTYEVTNCAAKFNGGVAYFGWIIAGTPLTSTNNSSNGQTTGRWHGAPFINPTTETNALTTDPLFTNPGSGDFTLQAGSPCIASGVDWGQTRDYAGNPMNGTPDRGAFER